jgi:hypothetical protein
MLDIDCSSALGIPQHRFEMWREYEIRDARRAKAKDPPSESVSLVPVEAPSEPAPLRVGLGLAFVSPHGYRIEGLTYEQAFALLKEFE